MVRKPLSGSIFRSLLCGAALSSAVIASGATLSGCRDENDPMTYVEELKDPVKQPVAIKTLIQKYEDAMTKDKKDRNGPNVKPLVDKIIEPLTKVCLDAGVKDRTRSTLVKFLADARDARAEACLKKTLEDYKPDTNEEDVQYVMRAVAAMKMTSLQAQVLKTFETIEYSRAKAKLIKVDVTNAVLAVSDKSQEDFFIKMLDKPFDNANQQAMQNEAFWQTVASRALGEMKSEKGARPLLKLILTPSKGPIANTALVAMVKIGKPAIKPAEALLKGEDTELVKWSSEEALKGAEKDKDGKIPDSVKKAAEKSYLATAAQVLGALGSAGSTGPLVSQAEKLAASDEKGKEKERAEELGTKVIICLSLPQLPRDPKALELYKKTYEDVKLDLETIAGPAKELMADSSSDFFDASLASFLVTSAKELKGESGEVDPVRSYSLVAATKVMKANQVEEVQALYDMKTVIEETDDKGKVQKKDSTIGKAFEKEFKQAKDLLGNCKDGVDCYFAALTSDENQAKEKQFTAIKAAYMIGILGGDGDRAKLVDALPKIQNDAVRITALKAFEVLTPKGDNAAADKLLGFYDKAEEAKDEESMKNFGMFIQSAARMRARAE